MVDRAVSMSVQETVKYTAALHRPAHRQPSIQTTARAITLYGGPELNEPLIYVNIHQSFHYLITLSMYYTIVMYPQYNIFSCHSGRPVSFLSQMILFLSLR